MRGRASNRATDTITTYYFTFSYGLHQGWAGVKMFKPFDIKGKLCRRIIVMWVVCANICSASLRVIGAPRSPAGNSLAEHPSFAHTTHITMITTRVCLVSVMLL